MFNLRSASGLSLALFILFSLKQSATSALGTSHLKVKESHYIALFAFYGFIKKFFSIDCANIYLFSIFFSTGFARWRKLFSIGCISFYLFSILFSIHFARWKSVALPHIVFIVIH